MSIIDLMWRKQVLDLGGECKPGSWDLTRSPAVTREFFFEAIGM